MERALKEKLLERKFRSIEYMEEMRCHHQASIDHLAQAIAYFYAHPPNDENWRNWHQTDWPKTWEERVLPNFQATQESLKRGIANAQKGDFSTILSASGSLHNIFRNLDNIGHKWWDYTSPALKDLFHQHLMAARDIASNVYRTVGKYWRPGSILDEEVTGPIDEQDLLRYLKPAEQA